HMLGESAGARVLAGDAHGPSLGFLDAAGGEAGADLHLVLARHDPGGDSEAAGAVLATELGIGARAQAGPGAEQRDRFEQIGLARAVIADQHHRPGVELELGPRIVAEISELERADVKTHLRGLARDRLAHAVSLRTSLHTRIGMST